MSQLLKEYIESLQEGSTSQNISKMRAYFDSLDSDQLFNIKTKTRKADRVTVRIEKSSKKILGESLVIRDGFNIAWDGEATYPLPRFRKFEANDTGFTVLKDQTRIDGTLIR